jgi:hypothetical protein
MSLDCRSRYENSVVGIITAVALGALAGSLVLLGAPPDRNRPLTTHLQTLSQWRRPPRKLQ